MIFKGVVFLVVGNVVIFELVAGEGFEPTTFGL